MRFYQRYLGLPFKNSKIRKVLSLTVYLICSMSAPNSFLLWVKTSCPRLPFSSAIEIGINSARFLLECRSRVVNSKVQMGRTVMKAKNRNVSSLKRSIFKKMFSKNEFMM